MNAHSTAIIHSDAKIASDVEIGPFAIIEAGVSIESGCKIAGHVQLLNNVSLGANCEIGGGSIIGGDPQDLKFESSTSSCVEIGPGNRMREHVTIHRGAKEGSLTRVGASNYLMTGSHLGHDVEIGDENVLANNVLLGGHVIMGDCNFLGGGSAYHQFIRIGDYCMVKGNSSVSQDVPPYVLCALVNEIHGLNVIGLRRAGFDANTRKNLKHAYDSIYRSGKNLSQAVKDCENADWSEPASKFLQFFAEASEKGVCRPPKRGSRE